MAKLCGFLFALTLCLGGAEGGRGQICRKDKVTQCTLSLVCDIMGSGGGVSTACSINQELYVVW